MCCPLISLPVKVSLLSSLHLPLQCKFIQPPHFLSFYCKQWSLLLYWFLWVLWVVKSFLKIQNKDPQTRKNYLLVLQEHVSFTSLGLGYPTHYNTLKFYSFSFKFKDFIFLYNWMYNWNENENGPHFHYLKDISHHSLSEGYLSCFHS